MDNAELIHAAHDAKRALARKNYHIESRVLPLLQTALSALELERYNTARESLEIAIEEMTSERVTN